MPTVEDVTKDTEAKMGKAIEATRADFAGVRTGRATPALLDRIQVEVYGTHVPLKQAASISSPDGRSLLISAFDRSTVGAIRKAIETSDLGLSPNVDGSNIRLGIPPLTEDRRKDLVKVIRKKAEEHKVALRNIRHHSVDAIKTMVKSNDITEDGSKRANDLVQKITDRYVKQVDELVGNKEKEIMEV